MPANGGKLLPEKEKNGLGDVIGEGRVMDLSAGGGVNHSSVLVDELGEGIGSWVCRHTG